MSQPNLFGPPDAYGGFTPPPLAGRSDPVTSHEAAARTAKSERAARHRHIVLALVRAFAGSTGHELWHAAAREQQAELETYVQVYRKLNDLRRAGLISQGDARICSVRKVRCVTWFEVE